MGWEDHLRKNNENDYRYSVPEKGEIIVNNEIKLKQNENQSGIVIQTSHTPRIKLGNFLLKSKLLTRVDNFHFNHSNSSILLVNVLRMLCINYTFFFFGLRILFCPL